MHSACICAACGHGSSRRKVMFKRFTLCWPCSPLRPAGSARVAARPPPPRRSRRRRRTRRRRPRPPPPIPPPRGPGRHRYHGARGPGGHQYHRRRHRRRRQRQDPGDLVCLAALPGPDRPVEEAIPAARLKCAACPSPSGTTRSSPTSPPRAAPISSSSTASSSARRSRAATSWI